MYCLSHLSQTVKLLSITLLLMKSLESLSESLIATELSEVGLLCETHWKGKSNVLCVCSHNDLLDVFILKNVGTNEKH